MPPVIECCLRTATDPLRRRLDETGATIRLAPCLQRCGTCRREEFVLVDGDLRAGVDCDRVLDELRSDDE